MLQEEKELRAKLAGGGSTMQGESTSRGKLRAAGEEVGQYPTSESLHGLIQGCRGKSKNVMKGKECSTVSFKQNKQMEALDSAKNLEGLTGIKFDMSGFLKDETGVQEQEIQNVMSLTDEVSKSVKGKKVKRRKHHEDTSDSNSDGDSFSSSEEDYEVRSARRKNLKKVQCTVVCMTN